MVNKRNPNYHQVPSYRMLQQIRAAAEAEIKMTSWFFRNGYTLVPGTHDMWEKKQ